jgi:hypothetical protein
MKLFYYIFLGCFVVACTNNTEDTFTIEDDSETSTPQEIYVKTNHLPATQWLVGNWKDMAINTKGQSHEVWWLNDAGHLEGKEFFVKPNLDTSKIAYNSILPHMEGFQFSNVTKDTVFTNFKLKTFGEDSLRFENPSHKWPQIITYKKVTPDSILITLDGYVFESQRTLFFEMKRY